MVLNHIAKRARLFIIGRSGADAFGFADGDLDMVDVLVVPNRLKNAVGESHDHQVLDGFFSEIVIDPENLRFVEYPTGHGVDLLGGGKVAAHRLFHNDARIGLSGANGEARMLESLAHGGKGTWWDAEIKNAVAG